ncbi:MAG: hypothetical protein QME69_03390 [Candidatus Saccharicenans sp.]|nr:hypothetical protein [Candidatus Saccharicenans sp.]
MRKRFFIFVIFAAGVSLLFSQEQSTTGSKKALDAFINATTKGKNAVAQVEPVPGATVMIELLPGPKGPCTTRNDGVFGVNFSKLDEVQGKDSRDIKLRFTIQPKNRSAYVAGRYVFDFVLPKSQGPYFEFRLKFKRADKNSNKGEFIIERNLNVKAPPKQGPKQGKGSAVKTGDSYQGEVRHF